MVCSLILLYFDSPQISIISNTTIKLLTSVRTYQNSLIIAFLVPKGLRRVVFTELFYLQITAEVSKIKKCTQRGLYFTLYGLLKYFNTLQYYGVKRLLHEIWNVVTYRRKFVRLFRILNRLFYCYFMVFMNYSVGFSLTRNIR